MYILCPACYWFRSKPEEKHHEVTLSCLSDLSANTDQPVVWPYAGVTNKPMCPVNISDSWHFFIDLSV